MDLSAELAKQVTILRRRRAERAEWKKNARIDGLPADVVDMLGPEMDLVAPGLDVTNHDHASIGDLVGIGTWKIELLIRAPSVLLCSHLARAYMAQARVRMSLAPKTGGGGGRAVARVDLPPCFMVAAPSVTERVETVKSQKVVVKQLAIRLKSDGRAYPEMVAL